MIAITPGADFRKVVALEGLLVLEALEVEATQMEVEPDFKKVHEPSRCCKLFWSPAWEAQAPWQGEGAWQRHFHPWGRTA